MKTSTSNVSFSSLPLKKGSLVFSDYLWGSTQELTSDTKQHPLETEAEFKKTNVFLTVKIEDEEKKVEDQILFFKDGKSVKILSSLIDNLKVMIFQFCILSKSKNIHFILVEEWRSLKKVFTQNKTLAGFLYIEWKISWTFFPPSMLK